VVPVGGARPVKVNFSLVSATHRDLPALCAEERFRQDLMARLDGLRVDLPPLRRRREDLGLLIGRLLSQLAPSRAGELRFDREAAAALIRYEWPSNVRELETCLRRAIAIAPSNLIETAHLPEAVRAGAASEAGESTRLSDEDRRRRAEIEALLAEHGGNVTSVARAMQKARMQVQRWIKRFALDPERFRR
jgi:DNA-binding NtrC family response regulator